jgi:hypothetical protein
MRQPMWRPLLAERAFPTRCAQVQLAHALFAIAGVVRALGAGPAGAVTEPYNQRALRLKCWRIERAIA